MCSIWRSVEKSKSLRAGVLACARLLRTLVLSLLYAIFEVLLLSFAVSSSLKKLLIVVLALLAAGSFRGLGCGFCSSLADYIID